MIFVYNHQPCNLIISFIILSNQVQIIFHRDYDLLPRNPFVLGLIYYQFHWFWILVIWLYFRISLNSYQLRLIYFQGYPFHTLFSLCMIFYHRFQFIIPLIIDLICIYFQLTLHITFISHLISRFFLLVLNSNFLSNLIILSISFLSIINGQDRWIIFQSIAFIAHKDLLSIEYGFHILGFLWKMNAVSWSLVLFNCTIVSIDRFDCLYRWFIVAIFQILLTIFVVFFR